MPTDTTDHRTSHLDALLAAHGTNRLGVAALLDISPRTVTRNLRTAAPATLRALAAALNTPYSTLLRAALLDNGTIDTIDELLQDLPLHVVGSSDGQFLIDGIFTNADDADAWRTTADRIRDTDAHTVPTALLTAGALPEHVTITEMVWRHSNDQTTRWSRTLQSRPVSWGSGTTSSIEITCAADANHGGATRIACSALNSITADRHVTDTVLALRRYGLLAPRALNQPDRRRATTPPTAFTTADVTTDHWLDTIAERLLDLQHDSRHSTDAHEADIAQATFLLPVDDDA